MIRIFLFSIGRLIWNGLWTGIGQAAAFFLLWLCWRLLHSKIAHKFDPDHVIHVIHDYFS